MPWTWLTGDMEGLFILFFGWKGCETYFKGKKITLYFVLRVLQLHLMFYYCGLMKREISKEKKLSKVTKEII